MLHLRNRPSRPRRKTATSATIEPTTPEDRNICNDRADNAGCDEPEDRTKHTVQPDCIGQVASAAGPQQAANTESAAQEHLTEHATNPSSQAVLSSRLTRDERSFITNGEELDDNVATKAMWLIMKQAPQFDIQPTSLSALPSELRYHEEDTMFIHHIDTQRHFVLSTSVGGVVRIFDSLNLKISGALKLQIEAIYQPRQTDTQRRKVRQMKVAHKQRGYTDCGVYSIAYAVEVAMGTDPTELANIRFQRSEMRAHLERIFDAGQVSRFPSVPGTQRQSSTSTIDVNHRRPLGTTKLRNL